MIDASIFVLVTPGNREHLSACLASLSNTLPPGSRVATILVPQGDVGDLTGSLDQTPPRLTGRISVPAATGANSLAARRNAAVAADRAPTFCFLEAGTILRPGWLPPMLDLLHRAPRAGCVGNLHREPYSGLIEHAGLRFDAGGLPTGGPVLALPPREACARYPAVSLACAVVTRALLERIGGFDEKFSGPLGDVDFCLRAAASGTRHYVANRSVVYHHADLTPAPSAAADLALYRERWGNRAVAAHARRARIRRANFSAPYTLETWEMAREDRRLQRLQILQDRRDGRTYLGKHLHRPWRYNYARLCTALGKALAPLPPALPLAPGAPPLALADLDRPDDGWLFDPPPR